LADEINRTPPRTQSALLEAMQERQVSIANRKHPLEEPFFVLATQNPIEQEGTYRLPEAQLDRFMYLITIDYPKSDDEIEIMKRTTGTSTQEPEPVMSRELVLQYQRTVRSILVREDLYRYVLRIVQSTRVSQTGCSEHARRWVAWGAGPRACQNMILGAKARALFHGRRHVITEDIQAVAKPVLRHRVLMNYAAVSEGVRSDHVIEKIIESLPTPAKGSGGD
jgi:MoxR-like ATPase